MRIVIAEDSVILRDGLVQLLTVRGHEVVAAVSDATTLAAVVDEQLPELVVVDIRMPPTHTNEGLQAAIALRARHPGLGVLVFSQYVETRYAAELLAGGSQGVGYLLKDRVADVGDFMDALTRIAAGGTVLDPEVVTQLLGASRRTDSVDALTARERQVLRLMAEGRANAAIATALHLSPGAVEKHVTSIFGKLGLAPSTDDHRRVLAVLRWLDS
ncbi:MAG TPA: response regulator transcription factor [Mycobacteriales bacterium]|jgi:DNA-binding NarL/FixJ family response regulator|nr:response regulator transcription factor [Mycobacteriales bacterium]